MTDDPYPLQWGHGFSAVEMYRRAIDVRLPSRASMGPRLFSRGNLWDSINAKHPWDTLQWGHGFSAVEIPAFLPIVYAATLASMGPRLFSRGNHRLSLSSTLPGVSASMGPRLFSRGNDVPFSRAAGAAVLLQWGHGFSAVEISQTIRTGLKVAVASMGPRLFSRGNIQDEEKVDNVPPGFNGATAFQPWKSARIENGSDHHTRRFNGATAFQPWK